MTAEEKNTNPVLIRLDNISRSYGYGDATSYALRDFSLEVRRGEFIMIMGPSGCGKTTLLNVIGLLDQPTSGEYYLADQPTSHLSSRKKANLRGRRIGYIFQNFNLIPSLPVIENVALPLIYSGKSKTRRLLTASEMLSTFHLSEREYYYPHQLSGGQQQRVCIARSLVNHPEIILADEPTGNLDSRSSHIVMEELRNIHSEGNTIIMVTHNPQLTTYATRVIHMLDGGIDADIKTVLDEDLPEITNLPADAHEDAEPAEPAEKYSSDDIILAEPSTKSAEPIETPLPEVSAPLGEIADEPTRSATANSFPVVGSEFVDKSVRIASKPSMEDLVVPSKSPRHTTSRSTARTSSRATRSKKGVKK